MILSPRPDLRREDEIPKGQSRIRRVWAQYESAAGQILASWCLEDDGFTYCVTIPKGVTAHMEIPLVGEKKVILVNDAPMAAQIRDGYAIFSLDGGVYTIRS